MFMSNEKGRAGLFKYLADNDETQKQFSKRTGVPESTLSRLKVGGVPNLRDATAIEAATGGKVKAAGWLDAE